MAFHDARQMADMCVIVIFHAHVVPDKFEFSCVITGGL